jgi:hypothetical protein
LGINKFLNSLFYRIRPWEESSIKWQKNPKMIYWM